MSPVEGGIEERRRLSSLCCLPINITRIKVCSGEQGPTAVWLFLILTALCKSECIVWRSENEA